MMARGMKLNDGWIWIWNVGSWPSCNHDRSDGGILDNKQTKKKRG